MSDRAAVTLDMSGLSCPLPLLGAKKILDDLPDGQHMILISDCPGTGDDLRAWASITGHEVVRAEPLNGRRVAYTIRRNSGPARFGGNVMLDMRGAACPGPIVEAERLLHGMRAGEVLVLIGNCPGICAEVEAWTANSAVELIDRFEAVPGEYEFYLRRK
ncbi:MAG: sulfurtransferase TusA family protein [Burkholderiaceae bacterium]